MKTTIALSKVARIRVESIGHVSTGCTAVHIEQKFDGEWETRQSVALTQDQAGALIFGLEKAAEAARIAQERAAAGAA